MTTEDDEFERIEREIKFRAANATPEVNLSNFFKQIQFCDANCNSAGHHAECKLRVKHEKT